MTEDSTIRIGAVSYLNTVPLVEGLGEVDGLELSLDLPSRLADQLADGRLDVALIPCIEFFQRPEYIILSDACIACRGPVMSVKLISRVPFPRIQSIALDEGSRTSVALVRILLKHRFGIAPREQGLPMGTAPLHMNTDACLIIGDRAMHGPTDEFPYQWDLGEQWCEWSGLPFVFAMWVARDDDTGRGRWPFVERELAAARDRGVSRLDAIALRHAADVGLSRERCLIYLRDNLHFFLGHRELAGLRRFRELAHQCDLAPAPDVLPGLQPRTVAHDPY